MNPAKKAKPVEPASAHNREAHIVFLKVYAAHASHPHAPAVCVQARLELVRLEPQMELLT